MTAWIKRFWRQNSLTIVIASLFLIFLFGQSIAGVRHFNEEQQNHQQMPLSYTEYLSSPHFAEAVFENWESEFLQMAAYVIFTAFLVQKGSAESKEPGKGTQRNRLNAGSPGLARYKGIPLKLYENSLFLVLFGLFVASFVLHAASGAGKACEEALQHGGECYSTAGYMSTSQFWFESFQNWQSEFLAVASLIMLSIVLRQKNSPESKRVPDPHSKTG